MASIAAYIQKGDIIDYTNSGTADIAYHEIVALASGIGIAQEPIAVGETGSLAIAPQVFGLPTEETAVDVGTLVYFDPSTGMAAKAAASGAVVAGIAVGAPSGGILPVKINTVIAAPASE